MIDIDYTIIGKRLKEARQDRCITQEELSEMLDISCAYLSRVERGKVNVNLKRLMQMCNALNVSIAKILTGTDTNSKQYLEKELHEILLECTPEKQKMIYDIAKLVAKTNFI